MAAIGNSPTQQAFTPAIDYFSGNGSTTAFTLSRPVASVAQVQVTIDNVAQNPSSAYTVSANTITFTSAPLSGTNNIYVYYTSPITQVIAPGQGTVGTTQIQNGVTVNFADGTAAAPSITNDGDTNTGIFFPAADTIAFSEGGAESMRIDSSGNVGIGTTSPTALTSNKALTINSPTGFGSLLDLKTNETLNLRVFSNASNSGLSVKTATPLLFDTNDTERMRIDSSGNVGIGTTSPSTYGNLAVYTAASNTEVAAVTGGANYCTFSLRNSSRNYSMQIRTDQSNAWVLRDETAGLNRFYVSTNTAPRFGFGTGSIITATTQGMFTGFAGTGGQTFNFGPNQTGSYVVFSGTTGVYIDAGNTSWSSTSDERVKENLIPIENGLTKVASLRAVTGNFIDDKAKKSRAFLIAQDVQAVLPEAISIQKDEQQTLGIQYTDVIPLLVASIKELKAINDTQAETINALTARIEALENR